MADQKKSETLSFLGVVQGGNIYNFKKETAKSGTDYATASLRVSRPEKEGFSSGFVNLTFFGRLIEYMSKVPNGSAVLVSGRLDVSTVKPGQVNMMVNEVSRAPVTLVKQDQAVKEEVEEEAEVNPFGQ